MSFIFPNFRFSIYLSGLKLANKCLCSHYENLSMQDSENFFSVANIEFFFLFFLFLLKTYIVGTR